MYVTNFALIFLVYLFLKSAVAESMNINYEKGNILKLSKLQTQTKQVHLFITYSQRLSN